MTLQHCTLQKIERKAPGADIVLNLRDSECDKESVYSLFEQLKHSFMRSSQKQYGCFDNARSDTVFPQWLRDQQQGKLAFNSMAKHMTEQLKLLLDNIEDAFSAHLLFAVESVMGKDLFYLFWFSHIEAQHINSHLEVESCQYIDSNRPHFGLKLDIDGWQEGDSPKYLSLLCSRGNRLLSEAFTELSAFTTGIDQVKDTAEFLDIVDQYAEQLPEQQSQEYRGKVIDYCVSQDSIGAPVVFEELSSQLDEQQPEQFSRFVAERQQQPKTEIHTDRPSLKRYIRFFGRDRNMSISFSSDLYGDDIQYDADSGELTIKQVPKSLKQQLANYRLKAGEIGKAKEL